MYWDRITKDTKIPINSCRHLHFNEFSWVLHVTRCITWLVIRSKWQVYVLFYHVNVGFSYDDTAGPRIADGAEDLQMWRVAENALNKQSLTADKGWSVRFGKYRREYKSFSHRDSQVTTSWNSITHGLMKSAQNC
jgi:hypothetical protein